MSSALIVTILTVPVTRANSYCNVAAFSRHFDNLEALILHQPKGIHHNRLIDLAIGIVAADVAEDEDAAVGGLQATRVVGGAGDRPDQAPFKPFGTIGRERRRCPVAWKMALATAGATATMGVSPAPAEGRSLRSSRMVSSAGTSAKRGMR